jgi:hypothetical protein
MRPMGMYPVSRARALLHVVHRPFCRRSAREGQGSGGGALPYLVNIAAILSRHCSMPALDRSRACSVV